MASQSPLAPLKLTQAGPPFKRPGSHPPEGQDEDKNSPGPERVARPQLPMSLLPPPMPVNHAGDDFELNYLVPLTLAMALSDGATEAGDEVRAEVSADVAELNPVVHVEPPIEGTSRQERAETASETAVELNGSRASIEQAGGSNGTRLVSQATQSSYRRRSTASDSPNPNFSAPDFKKANELATIFLDTRKVLKADCNIVMPLSELAHLGHPGHESSSSPVSVSRLALLRAEKVKLMIAVKYLYIQRQYDFMEARGGKVAHPGVEGVYNPLQIIRNRKIRAKYHEYPKQLSIKTLPLACNVFSKHNKHHKRPWKMIWLVELNELLLDTGWRTGYWHELVNPRGQLWFPPPEKTEKEHRKRQVLHDMLFEEKSLLDDDRSKLTAPLEQRTLRSPVRLRDRVRNRALHRRKASHLIPSLDEQVSGNSGSTPGGGEGSEEDANRPLSIVVPSNRPKVPMITVEPEEEIASNPGTANLALGEVSFHHQARDEETDSTPEDPGRGSLATNILGPELALALALADPRGLPERIPSPVISLAQFLDSREVELNHIQTDFGYLEAVVKLKLHYLLNVYPALTESVEEKLSHLTNDQVGPLLLAAVNINDNQLSVFQRLFNAYSKEIQLVIHMANDEHLVKIDHLLSASDRSIGEINTSLNLEVRKISEKIDKLAGSLSRSCNIKTGTPSDESNPLELGSRTLYFLLETAIVVVLRTVWIVVNIYNFVAYVFKAVWRVVRFILT